MNKGMYVRGLDELRARMMKYPLEYAKAVALTMATALLVFWENVPQYPPPPSQSGYVRTGTLGRSLGSSMLGGKTGGRPDKFDIIHRSGYDEGRFGSKLGYAPKVIGPVGVQQYPFSAYWWRLESVAGRSFGRILGLFQKMADKLAAFLDKGL